MGKFKTIELQFGAWVLDPPKATKRMQSHRKYHHTKIVNNVNQARDTIIVVTINASMEYSMHMNLWMYLKPNGYSVRNMKLNYTIYCLK